MKKNTKIIVFSITAGLIGGIITNNSHSKKALANQDIKEDTVLTTNKELYKQVSTNIKFPKKVHFQEKSSKLEKNKVKDIFQTSLQTLPTGTKNYQHSYQSDNKQQHILFNVITRPTVVDLDGVAIKKKITLSSGVEATYSDDDHIQTLSFNDPTSNLFYSLVAQKKDGGKFTIEELTDILNSLDYAKEIQK
ncbi:hypothetical protein ACFVRR_06335 [Gottfriedia sp. NPDC057948]|uniref:hypothetical protein n=1 Tax=Gottfriedia sp. NPDC057948 TaxID=3346287 RepID=UPI0036D8F308